ncbi:MAG: hypothetical protein Q7K45_06920, partial [Nanoarchaeota archaeon]|nr:hypothetical protein [Nanoarchaeota archaeon]
MLTSDLTDIVSTIRRDFENGKINDKELKLLYLQYSLLKDIGLFVDRAKLLFPHLNCGLASVYLQKLFPQA